jgi:hypothetical protein
MIPHEGGRIKNDPTRSGACRIETSRLKSSKLEWRQLPLARLSRSTSTWYAPFSFLTLTVIEAVPRL